MSGILLSYPRCGNSWLRFCVEAISKKPTSPNNTYIQEMRNFIRIDSQESVLEKAHTLFEFGIDGLTYKQNKTVYHNTKLILLLRNYKECIMRQNNNYEDSILPKQKRFNYMENIIEFETWPKENGLVVYYEDLIVNPKTVLKQCIDFLKLNGDGIDEFIDKHDHYKQKSIEVYDKLMGSSSKGKDLSFHSDKKSKEFLKQWDNKIKEKHLDMFNKYLIRYEEK